MKAAAFSAAMAAIFVLCLGQAQVFGDTAEATPVQPRPKAKAVDLDFSDDDDDAPLSAAKPVAAAATAKPNTAAAITADKSGSHAWIYWTLGAGLMAGGGALWYVRHEGDKAPTVIRTEQVFTDDR